MCARTERAASDRFEELLRELRAEHERLLRAARQPSEEPPAAPKRGREAPSWPPGRGVHELQADSMMLPGAPAFLPPRMLDAERPSDDPHSVVPWPARLSQASLESVVEAGKGQVKFTSKIGGVRLTRASSSPAVSGLWGVKVEQNTGLAGVVTSAGFELTMAFIILLNTFCIAAEAQYRGMESGYDYGVAPGHPEPVDKAWPGADSVFLGLEWFFGILFTIELLLKVVAIPRDIPKDAWNIVDFLVVIFFWIETLSSDLPFPPTLIRLARMARLLRFLRVVKTVKGFDSLYLMLQSIKGSLSALGWSSVVLLLGEMMLALALNLLMMGFWEDESRDLHSRQVLFEYFGTFTRSLLTMLEMLLGNWFTITRILTDFNELFMVFGVCHQLIFGFAVIQVISGVFLNETFKVAALDDSIMMNEVRRAATAESAKLTEFFQKADKDGSGQVDLEEFRSVLDNEQVLEWLSAMGLDLGDIDRVFGMLDTDGDGQISCQELVAGASMLKKPARAVDLAAMQTMLEDVRARIFAEQ